VTGAYLFSMLNPDSETIFLVKIDAQKDSTFKSVIQTFLYSQGHEKCEIFFSQKIEKKVQ